MQSIEHTMKSEQESFQQKLSERIAQIRNLWLKLRFVKWSQEGFVLMRKLVHQLAAGGAYMEGNFGEIALRLDRILLEAVSTNRVPSERVRARINDLLMQLASYDQAPVDEAEPSVIMAMPQFPEQVRVMIVDDDEHIVEFLKLHLEVYGYQVETYSGIPAALNREENKAPDIVLMDLGFPEGEMAGITACSRLRERYGHTLPVVFISARTDISARLQAVRIGGNGYFDKPLDIDAIINKIQNLVVRSDMRSAKVLVVEDDADLADFYKLLLEKEEMRVKLVTKPLQTLENMIQFRPDVVIMDYHMPDCNGRELAEAIRQDERFTFTPIVFVTSEDDRTLRKSMIELGVDGFLQKPIDGHALIETVKERIQSAQRLKKRMRRVTVRDPDTGLVNKHFFNNELDIVLNNINPGGPHRAFIYIHIDEPDQPLSQEANSSRLRRQSNAIRKELAGEDSLCHMNAGVYLLLTRALDVEQIKHIAEGIGQRLAVDESRDAVAIGVMFLDGRITTRDTLLMRAEEAAARARTSGLQHVYFANSPKCMAAETQISEDMQQIIETALKNKAFRLAYQPIVPLSGEHEELYEVYVRMQDEDGGLILPNQFIPYLVSIDRFRDMEDWVWRHAVQTVVADELTAGSKTFFIKLSDQAVAGRDTLQRILDITREEKLVGQDMIVFQISESAAMSHKNNAARLIEGLHEINWQVGINHFGSVDATGRVLDWMKPDFVKVQEPFITKLSVDRSHQDQMKQLIDKARSKDVRLIVGGVEDPSIIALLWKWDVRYYQGYFVQGPQESLSYDFSQDALEVTD